MATHEIDAVVLRVVPSKAYAMLGSKIGDIYLPFRVLKQSGITGKIMKGSSTTVEYIFQEDGGRRAVVMHELDGRQATRRSKKNVSMVKAPKTDVSPQPRPRRKATVTNKVNVIYMDRKRGFKKHFDKRTKKVWYTADGEKGRFMTYGGLLEYFGVKVSHPVPEGCGQKTNDPRVSQGMKGASQGGGKQNTA